MLIVLLFVCWMWVGQLFCLEIRSRCLFAICFDGLWCFYGGPGMRWPSDLVLNTGRPIALIRDRESVLWFKFGFGLLLVFFRWIGVCAVLEAD